MPEQTLLDFGDHGEIGELLPADGGNSDATLYACEQARVDVYALANQLQREGAESFVQSWNDLMACIKAKSGCWPAHADETARLVSDGRHPAS